MKELQKVSRGIRAFISTTTQWIDTKKQQRYDLSSQK
jgi:hypothetical protein